MLPKCLPQFSEMLPLNVHTDVISGLLLVHQDFARDSGWTARRTFCFVALLRALAC